jgi:hypothetical protein
VGLAIQHTSHPAKYRDVKKKKKREVQRGKPLPCAQRYGEYIRQVLSEPDGNDGEQKVTERAKARVCGPVVQSDA